MPSHGQNKSAQNSSPIDGHGMIQQFLSGTRQPLPQSNLQQKFSQNACQIASAIPANHLATLRDAPPLNPVAVQSTSNFSHLMSPLPKPLGQLVKRGEGKTTVLCWLLPQL